jgi:hypothetical protein
MDEAQPALAATAILPPGDDDLGIPDFLIRKRAAA